MEENISESKDFEGKFWKTSMAWIFTLKLTIKTNAYWLNPVFSLEVPDVVVVWQTTRTLKILVEFLAELLQEWDSC